MLEPSTLPTPLILALWVLVLSPCDAPGQGFREGGLNCIKDSTHMSSLFPSFPGSNPHVPPAPRPSSSVSLFSPPSPYVLMLPFLIEFDCSHRISSCFLDLNSLSSTICIISRFLSFSSLSLSFIWSVLFLMFSNAFFILKRLFAYL